MSFEYSYPVNTNAFPGKLWKLVNDESYQSITWSSCGTWIVIESNKFKEEVLRSGDYSIFKTQNFSSFVRQLNLYGFRKLATSATKLVDEKAKRGFHSRPLQCFTHSYFVKHRPELVSKVRRTSSATKQRLLGQYEQNGYYYGQYGNTFRVLSRYESNAMSPYGFHSPTGNSSAYLHSHMGLEESPSKTGGSASQSHSNSHSPHSVESNQADETSLSSSFCSESDHSDDEEENVLSKPSSANVWLGQGCEDECPQSPPHLTLIAKAEKGSMKATRTTEEAVSFPSCLYDSHGRLKKFVVIQQSPRFGCFQRAWPYSYSQSQYSSTHGVSCDVDASHRVTPPALPHAVTSGHYVPYEVDTDHYSYYPVDYPYYQYPCYPGYLTPYVPDYMCLPQVVHPENCAPASAYCSSEEAANSPPLTADELASLERVMASHSSGQSSTDLDDDEIQAEELRKGLVEQTEDKAPVSHA